jgi:hypothetical protein
MSATTEQSLKDPATTAGSAPGSDRVDAQQPAPGAGAGAGPSKAGDGKVPEKTISCVSCRKRKLKCDRTKPKCGTCIRLRHDCEYPERRRNLGSKRRNMKELEARLGMPPDLRIINGPVLILCSSSRDPAGIRAEIGGHSRTNSRWRRHDHGG